MIERTPLEIYKELEEEFTKGSIDSEVNKVCKTRDDLIDYAMREYLNHIKCRLKSWGLLTSISDLKRGDLVRSANMGIDVYMVNSVFGARATATNTKDITNAEEWLVYK